MDGSRLNTIDRTLVRLDGVEVDEVRTQSYDEMTVDTGYESASPALNPLLNATG